MQQSRWNGSSATRTVYTKYNPAGSGPYSEYVGFASNGDIGDGDLLARRSPVQERTIEQQGTKFVWHANSFDTYARPISVSRSDSRGNARAETITYSDNLTKWVLGQTASITESASGAIMVANTFNATTAAQESNSTFGKVNWTATYNADGTVATRKDGNSYSTAFSNYKRGIAQKIAYPNATGESAVINNLGLTDSITDGAGFTTAFSYDTAGRLSAITPPGADTVAWNATSLSFVKVNSDEYGIGAGHWRQTISTGNATTITYFDALWRPLVTRTYDTGNESSTSKIVVRRFDFQGNVIFESYPQRAISTVTDNLDGITRMYDVLGRLTETTADSELGDLRTTVRYEDGFTKKIINPRGFETIFGYKTYDQPNEEWIAYKDESYGVRTAFTRDQFGKPLAITKSDANYSAVRSYVYDAQARLCKIIEPEIGATVISHDAADNIAWRAIGVDLSSTTSCDLDSVTAAKKISYSYDQRNWLKGITYGDNSPAVTYTYLGDGVPATASSNGAVWSYTYNKRRLLEKESLAYGGKTYNIGRSYDANGSLSTLTYPGAAPLSVSYTPNALGQPTQVSGYASNIQYFPNATLDSFNYANGVAHTSLQNTRGLIYRVRDEGVLFDEYKYDEVGNVTEIKDLEQGVANRTMTYDGLDRLTTATANGSGMWGTATYSTDGLDNIRQISVTSGANTRHTLHYYGTNNQLNSIGGSSTLTLAYDSQGNLIIVDPESETMV